ncbi:MAG: heavy-metal-associated domain-containing protein [Limisphaerales bacterium]
MKTTLLLLLASLSLSRAAEKPTTSVNASATNQFRITGMNCAGCAGGLEAELRLTPGVARVSVTLTNGLAVVAFDTNRVATGKLLKVIAEAGFKGALLKP